MHTAHNRRRHAVGVTDRATGNHRQPASRRNSVGAVASGRANVAASIRSRIAYTMIEMLSVLALISLLVALVIGLYNHTRDVSRTRQAQAELGELHHALQQFYLVFGHYPDLEPTDPPEDGPDDGSVAADRLFDPEAYRQAPPDGFQFSDWLAPGFEAIDPWNRPYRYAYSPDRPDTYDLFSHGADPDKPDHDIRFQP